MDHCVGTYTTTGEYISPNITNEEFVSNIYICAGEKIKSVNSNDSNNNFVILAKDTQLLYTTNINGTVNGCNLTAKYNGNYRFSKKENKIPTGFTRNNMFDQFNKNNSKSTNNGLEEGKLYVNNISFYVNGFTVLNDGMQEIILDSSTKLKVIESEIELLDEDNNNVTINADKLVFKFTNTTYTKPEIINIEPTLQINSGVNDTFTPVLHINDQTKKYYNKINNQEYINVTNNSVQSNVLSDEQSDRTLDC